MRGKSLAVGFALLCLALILMVAPLQATPEALRVAILGSPGGGPPWNEDVKSKLLSTGMFSRVDVYAIDQVTPTVNELLAYKSVLVFSDAGYADPEQLGDNLAEYVDQCGGVGVAVFANASVPFAGRFDDEEYWVIMPGGQTQGTRLTLGEVHRPGHRLMEGVTTFDGGDSSYRSFPGDLHPAARRIADWSNGAPLIATRTIGGTRRVDLNFFPVSSDQRSDFWAATTDGARIMANALVYAKGHHRRCDNR